MVTQFGNIMSQAGLGNYGSVGVGNQNMGLAGAGSDNVLNTIFGGIFNDPVVAGSYAHATATTHNWGAGQMPDNNFQYPSDLLQHIGIANSLTGGLNLNALGAGGANSVIPGLNNGAGNVLANSPVAGAFAGMPGMPQFPTPQIPPLVPPGLANLPQQPIIPPLPLPQLPPPLTPPSMPRPDRPSGPVNMIETLLLLMKKFAPVSAEPPAAKREGTTTGRVWGDPHFEGFDGEKFDFMGKAGSTYNILKDRGINFNAEFGKFGDGNATVMKKVGLEICGNQLEWSANGKPTLNGRELKEGESFDLGGGQTVKMEGGVLKFKLFEYEFEIKQEGSGDKAYFDMNNVKLKGDGVAGGLLGLTAKEGKQFEGSAFETDGKRDQAKIEAYGEQNFKVNGLFDDNTPYKVQYVDY
jgi:hypothetical protein